MNTLTAKDILEIIEKAHERGAIHIEIGDLKLTFVAETAKNAPPPARRSSEFCRKHNEDYSDGQYGPYCRSCSAEKKERNWKRNRTW